MSTKWKETLKIAEQTGAVSEPPRKEMRISELDDTGKCLNSYICRELPDIFPLGESTSALKASSTQIDTW